MNMRQTKVPKTKTPKSIKPKKCFKRDTTCPTGGLPGVTRKSMIDRLKGSLSSKAWDGFLRDGPYWNYLAMIVRSSKIFQGRDDLVQEAVMSACEKVARVMTAKQYEYPENVTGVFRAWLKKVVTNAAYDVWRATTRREAILEESLPLSDAERKNKEAEKLRKELDKVLEKQVKKNAKLKAFGGLKDEIDFPSESELDICDKEAGFERKITKEKKFEPKMHSLMSLDAEPFSDDESPVNFNPADIFGYNETLSKENSRWLFKLQIHTLYLALGHVLTNPKISAERRELLRLRYGLDMKITDIMAQPRFKDKKRSAIEAQMSRATDDLKNEFLTWWELVSPKKHDFADEKMLRLWRDFSRSFEVAQLARILIRQSCVASRLSWSLIILMMPASASFSSGCSRQS